MNKYVVSIPIAGCVHIEVEAANEKEAKEAAWQKIDDCAGTGPDADIEWEFFNLITEGNVCHAPINEIVVAKLEEQP